MNVTRREFLLHGARGCLGYAAGASMFAAGVHRFGLINALAQGPGYKALVCVFLAGGNDGNNMVVPLSEAGYDVYTRVRGPSGLALQPADFIDMDVTPANIGEPFGFHPSCLELHSLFTQGKAALVCNVGPLAQPLTKDQYLDPTVPRPFQLFSHSDQIAQWQTAIADRVSSSGWGGRVADLYSQQGSIVPTSTALAGGIFTRGEATSALSIPPAPSPPGSLLLLDGYVTIADEPRRVSMEYLRNIDLNVPFVAAVSRTTKQSIEIGQTLASDVTLNTEFPDTPLGNQLKQVAKIIKFNSTAGLGLNRQIFFCQLGGFDTHQNQLETHRRLLAQMSQAIAAFHRATTIQDLNLEDSITTFTLSDFGRTFQPSGTGSSVGTDHAWGSHHFVVGGAVNGGDFYGVPRPNGTVFPDLALGGDSDTDTRGRWIPTVSVEQYAATLASWFGVSTMDLDGVFPNLNRFPIKNLGFML